MTERRDSEASASDTPGGEALAKTAPPRTELLRAAPVRGILLMILAGALFVCLDSIAKYLTADYSTLQLTWARFFFHLALFPLLLGAGRWRLVLRTRRVGLHFVRSLLLVGANFSFFLAVKYIPLADATSIGFVSPLLVTAFSVLLLGERVGPRRWAAVAVGFAAVFAIIRPGFADVHWAMFLPLVVALCFSLYQITTRILGATDHWVTILFFTASGGLLVTSIVVPFSWIWPDWQGWALMALMGVFGGLSHWVLIRAFTYAPASTLAPLGYVQLVWSILAGLLVFGDFPDLWTLLGAATIAASGIYVLLRERRLARLSKAQSPAD
ncbi:MAG: DMT family transporter [Dongiaceae bacterium]